MSTSGATMCQGGRNLGAVSGRSSEVIIVQTQGVPGSVNERGDYASRRVKYQCFNTTNRASNHLDALYILQVILIVSARRR